MKRILFILELGISFPMRKKMLPLQELPAAALQMTTAKNPSATVSPEAGKASIYV